MLNLTVQYLEKYSTVQQLAYRGLHWVNRQEELLTGGERAGGWWRSWRIVSNKRWRGQTAISLTPDIDGSWFLAGFSSIYIDSVLLSSVHYYSVRYTKAQPLIEDAHTEQCVPDTWANLKWLDKPMHFRLFESLQLEGSYEGTYCYREGQTSDMFWNVDSTAQLPEFESQVF